MDFSFYPRFLCPDLHAEQVFVQIEAKGTFFSSSIISLNIHLTDSASKINLDFTAVSVFHPLIHSDTINIFFDTIYGKYARGP